MPPNVGGADEHLLLPITALAIRHGDGHILVGSGPDLQVYSSEDSTLISSHRLFAGQAIHGISSNSHGTLAWGGTQIAVSSNDDFDVGRYIVAPDWILDANITDAGSVYAITAHNVLLYITTTNDNNEVEALTNPSRGLLMSAQVHLPPSSAAPLLVVTGSQFGEIIVWSYHNGIVRTHYTIDAHEGPVFGVDLANGLLASCSDDRMVKIWDVSELVGLTTADGLDELVTQHLTEPLASGMRHESRVWLVRFVQEADDSGDRCLLSAGEDATCRLWQLDRGSGDLKHLASHKDHDGKNVWSMTSQKDEHGSWEVITGGADGAVSRRPLSTESCPDQSTPKMFQLNLDRFVHTDPKDFVRAYDFLDHWALLLTTDKGHVYEYKLCKGQNPTVAYIGTHDDLKRYAVVKSLATQTRKDTNDLCVFAGSTGKIFLYVSSRRSVTALADLGVKVAGLFPSSAPLQSSPGKANSLCLLATSLSPGHSKLFCFSMTHETTTSLRLSSSVTVEHGSRIVTSSCVVSHKLLLGTRDGYLGILGLGADNSGVIDWKRVGDEAVTAVQCLVGGDTRSWLFTTSRDGVLRVYQVLNGEDRPCRLGLVHNLPLPFGPSIEGFRLEDAGGKLLVYGFDKTDFVIYDVASQRRLVTIDCGGSHRHWACKLDIRHAFAVAFASTRAGIVYGHDSSGSETTIIKTGGHGREIKACATRPFGRGRSDDQEPVLATGAEDTNIRLWRGRKPIATLRRHVTGIQELQWSEDGELLFSAGGTGELFVWRVRELPLEALPLGVVFESACPLSEDMLDLRVMSVSVTTLTHAGEEMRQYLVSLGLSNSSIMHYRYNTGETAVPKWELLCTNTYTSACVTQVRHLRLQDRLAVLSASTDGHLALWTESGSQSLGDANSESISEKHCFSIVKLERLHQSSVTALCSLQIAPSTYIIATGGDDNALGITLLFNNDSRNEGPGLRRHRVRRAHAAAVTAVTILQTNIRNKDNIEVVVVSSSNDQRVKTWHVNIDLARITVSSVRQRLDAPTPVADVSDIAELPGSGTVVICGVGMHRLAINAGRQ